MTAISPPWCALDCSEGPVSWPIPAQRACARNEASPGGTAPHAKGLPQATTHHAHSTPAGAGAGSKEERGSLPRIPTPGCQRASCSCSTTATPETASTRAYGPSCHRLHLQCMLLASARTLLAHSCCGRRPVKPASIGARSEVVALARAGERQEAVRDDHPRRGGGLPARGGLPGRQRAPGGIVRPGARGCCPGVAPVVAWSLPDVGMRVGAAAPPCCAGQLCLWGDC
jgi:hypothetical protein